MYELRYHDPTCGRSGGKAFPHLPENVTRHRTMRAAIKATPSGTHGYVFAVATGTLRRVVRPDGEVDAYPEE